MTFMLVVAVAVGGYVIGLPLMFRAKYRHPAEAVLTDVALADLPPLVDAELAGLMAAPTRAGFSLQLLVEVESAPPTTSHVAQLASLGTTGVEIMAMVTPGPVQTMLACCTTVRRPDGDIDIVTADTAIARPLRIPQLDYLRLPGLPFPELLAVHERRVAEALAMGGTAEHPAFDHDALRADLRRLPTMGQSRGLLRPPVDGMHRMTVYGAYRWTWANMWPVGTARRALVRRRASAYIAAHRATPRAVHS